MNGVLNIYKPPGPSSFGVVQLLKNGLGVKKAGHIGTLDPMAEGVLPICLNHSTKIIQFLTPLPKVYTTTMKLGVVTDTQDATGKVLETLDAGAVGEAEIRAAMANFVGQLQQIPPMFSAKKKNGVPLYKLARNGITIDRNPVGVTIYSLEFLKKNGDEVTFKIHCSAGTYVRSLCHDLGAQLGCGAHMARLVRNQVGSFDIKDALAPEAVIKAQEEGLLQEQIQSMEKVLSFIPEIRVKPDRIQAITHGVSLTKSSVEESPKTFKPGMNFRVNNDNNQLVAIVEPLVDQVAWANLASGDVAFKFKRVFV